MHKISQLVLVKGSETHYYYSDSNKKIKYNIMQKVLFEALYFLYFYLR